MSDDAKRRLPGAVAMAVPSRWRGGGDSRDDEDSGGRSSNGWIARRLLASSHLLILNQPSSTATAGDPLEIQPVIYEVDQYGILETSDNGTLVTAVPSSGSAQLNGATAAVRDGVATFTHLTGGDRRHHHVEIHRRQLELSRIESD